MPQIVRRGAEWYRSLGLDSHPGTKVISLSGDIQRPGNYEVPFGLPLNTLLHDWAGGPAATPRKPPARTRPLRTPPAYGSVNGKVGPKRVRIADSTAPVPNATPTTWRRATAFVSMSMAGAEGLSLTPTTTSLNS